MGVNLENSQTTIPVGTLNRHTSVEATGAHECFVQPIWPVRSSNNHNRLMCIKAVHLDQQLVQGLLTLVVAIDDDTALTTDGLDFIDEDDAGSRFLSLIEEVTHPTCAHADQHFDKL